MKLKAVDARSIDFAPYGKLFNLRAEGEGALLFLRGRLYGKLYSRPRD